MKKYDVLNYDHKGHCYKIMMVVFGLSSSDVSNERNRINDTNSGGVCKGNGAYWNPIS